MSTEMSTTLRRIRWFTNGDHPLDYPDTPEGNEAMSNGWEGHHVRYFRHPDVPGDTLHAECGYSWHQHGWIDGGGDGTNVCPGSWVEVSSASVPVPTATEED